MNQFKKAKLKQIESGQEVESVKGLQQAGIKQEEKSIDITNENTESNINVIQKTSNTSTKEIESQIELEKEDNINVEENNKLNEITNKTIIEEITQKEKIIDNIESKPISLSVPQPIKIEHINETIPESYEEIQSETLTNNIATKNIEILEEKYIEYEMPKPATKKIPNIFAPKDEAKSMRKSLVLKPTSVKKAENYCIRNGGSFNELVQTLLDNFISEYGL